MKKNFQRITSLFLVFVTLFNTVISPLTVQADTNTSNKGDLRVVTSSGTTTGDSVSITTGTNSDGSLVKNGDISITKTVSKTNIEGRYKVQFTVKGKDVKNETSTTKDVYVVVVLDKSGSMDGSKWTNAKSGAETFATSLLKSIKNAKIALVTFSGSKNDEKICKDWLFEKDCTYNLYNDATVVRTFQNTDFKDVKFGNAKGGTNLGEGLNKALNLFSDTTIPSDAFKYVVVLGDGEPTFYTNSEGYTEGPGDSMTSETQKYATDTATALKNKGVEIFSIGYSVIKDSTAEQVLKDVASVSKDTTTIKHYITADGTNESSVASSFNNIATSISYDYAGKNATINDGIGSNFTLTSGTNTINIGNITEDGITTEPFYIDIDSDSKTGWHQTNANFTLNYTKPDGTTSSITCDKNPEVYWVQNEYDYRIEYYYDGNIDTSLTETGTAFKDTKIEVLDTTINNSKHLKDGYKFVKVNPENKQITIKNNSENVIKVYYEKAEFSYTVEYYYDNKKDDSKTETKSALFESKIDSYTDKNKTGYKLDKTENLPLTITSDSKKNVIKVYYITDDSQRKDITYTVEYYKDGVLQENDTQKVTKNIQVLESEILKVDKDSINTSNKYYGYKFKESNPSIIPDTIVNGGVIKIYYEKDQDKTKELKYTVEYYKDGVLQENDTQKVTKEVQVLEADTLEVNKDNINTINKYEGYKFDSTNPNEIPTIIENNSVIKVYYVKDEFSYTVEYYYDNKKDDSKTETKSALFESKIDSYTDKNKTGYKLDKTENLPLTITSDSKKNVIKVYYVKNNYGYKVEYYYDNKLDDSMTYTNSVEYLSQVEKYPDKSKSGFSFVSDTAPLTITEITENNIIRVYYESNSYDYTIYHVEKDNEENILDIVKGNAKYQTEVLVEEEDFSGYTYDSKDTDTIIINTEKNIAYVYYTRNSYPYTIFHVEKDNPDNILEIEENNAKYQDEILVKEKDFTGYTYDSKDTDTIKIDTEINIAFVYYTKNNYDYTIYHVEKDNEENILDIVKGNAKYQTEVLVEEEDFSGYTYDSKDTDTIIINTEKNVAYVYYTRNKYNYTIEHYLENKDGSFSLKKKEEVKDVEFESDVVYKALEFAGYKYDATRDEAVEKVLEDNIVVRLYYVLADSNVTVHYVVKVDDNYISFDKYGRDEFGNNTEDFKDVDLLDDILTGKIGTNFTTKYREVKNYNFVGIYKGNILENSDLEKLDGTTISGEFDFEELEYTYVYEAPLGGDEIPPQTGFESNLSYLSYLLLVAVIYVLKKYFDLISEK